MACKYYFKALEFDADAEVCLKSRTLRLQLDCLKLHFRTLASNLGKTTRLEENIDVGFIRTDPSVIYNKLLSV
jgi:hypothetical protein